IAVAIDLDAMGPNEHTGAKAPDLLSGFVEVVDRIHLRAETARHRPRRTPIRCPYRFAVAIDGDTIGTAPRSSFDMRPIPDDTIRIRAGIDGLNFIGLGRSAPRLRLQRASAQRKTNHDAHNRQPESRVT